MGNPMAFAVAVSVAIARLFGGANAPRPALGVVAGSHRAAASAPAAQPTTTNQRSLTTSQAYVLASEPTSDVRHDLIDPAFA
jgi:hypothetical protein